MPILDMPLDELKRYKGITRKPDDFDTYWSKALTEMKNVKADVKLTKSDFQTSYADCYDLTFTGVRGAKIYSKLLKPKHTQDRCPAILQFHGYKGSSGDWFDKLPYVAAGFVVAAMDCRGQGGKSEDIGSVKGNTMNGHFIRGLDCDDPQDLLMRHIFLDTVQLANIVASMDEVDPERIGAFGGSQGGGLTIACASLANIKRLALFYPFLSDYKRVWDMDLDLEAYLELKEYFRLFDPLHKREDEVFRKLGYIDVHNLASRIKGKVLMGITMLDNVCPPSTQFAVYNNIKSEKKLMIYYDYGHEYLPSIADYAFEFFKKL